MGNIRKPKKYIVSFNKIFDIISENGDTELSFILKSKLSSGELQNFRKNKNIHINTIVVFLEKLENIYGKKYSLDDIVELKIKNKNK